MSHVYHLFLFLFCCFLCAQQLLWNMGTEYTKYDRTVGYIRPIQLPWPNQVTILNYCMVLRTTLMWESCNYNVGGVRHNIFVSRSHHHSILSISISLPYPTILCVTPSPLCILHPSHHHLLFAVQSDHWMAACRSPTGRGFLMLSTAACGDGLTFTAITSCEPSRPVSMPSTSKRMRSASTPTTTRGWRPQVRPQWTFVTFKASTLLFISASLWMLGSNSLSRFLTWLCKSLFYFETLNETSFFLCVEVSQYFKKYIYLPSCLSVQ